AERAPPAARSTRHVGTPQPDRRREPACGPRRPPQPRALHAARRRGRRDGGQPARRNV
ncbi:MAG: hypothetical protein AVDCRST_MAG67-3144, partial [uncultured Solirubrobacteraceae bacterium]